MIIRQHLHRLLLRRLHSKALVEVLTTAQAAEAADRELWELSRSAKASSAATGAYFEEVHSSGLSVHVSPSTSFQCVNCEC